MPMLTIPQAMEDEIKKSVYILREFAADAKKGPDTLIPASVFSRAKGVAILSYCKMGCFVSARGGSGIVVAKLPSGGWSAPSAVGILGLSGGLEFGVETTAIIMMLMYSNAVKAFMRGKNVALGGGISVAAGPFGRDLEADVAVKSPAAMYTYAKAKGLFVGINLGGTLVLERKKANEKCYGAGVRAYDILSGRVDVPGQCRVLHDVLKEQSRRSKREGIKQAVNIGSKVAEKKYGVKGLNKAATTTTDKALAVEDRHHQTSQGTGKTKFLSNKKSSRSGKPTLKTSSSSKSPRTAPSRPTKKGPAPQPIKRTPAPPPPLQRSSPVSRPQSSGAQQSPPRIWGQALHPFAGQLSCDISFQKDDRIEILARTGSEFDWWEGQFDGKIGIFPANYIRVIR